MSLKIFLTDSAYTLSRQIIGAALSLLTSIFLARLLGAEGIGIYNLVTLLPVMAYSFLNLGAADGIVYAVGKNRNTQKDQASSITWLALVLGVIGFLVSALVVATTSNRLFPGIPQQLLYLITFIIPIYFLVFFYKSFFQGLQDFIAFNLIPIIIASSNLILLVALVFPIERKAFFAIIAWMMSYTIILFIIPYFSTSVRWSDYFKPRQDKAFIRRIFGFGIRAHPGNLATFLSDRMDRYLLNFFLSPSEVGIYIIAVGLAEKLWMLSTAVGVVLFPRIAESGEHESIRRKLTVTVARTVLWATMLMGILLALFSRPIIRVLYGESFMRAAGAILVLLPGVVLFSVSRTISSDISGRGRPEINSILAIVMVVFNLTLNMIFIPRQGMLGAALAATLTYSVSAIVKLIIITKMARISILEIIMLKRSDISRIVTLVKDLLRARSRS